jgi:two-component system chemotaxis response regulator CheY
MRPRILVVDDVEFVRKTLAQILEDAGFEVVGFAQDGEEAITRYSEIKPDIVTMDVVMPRKSGTEATRAILSLDPRARIVMVSALGQESIIMEAIHLGASDYILKPFKKNEIADCLNRVLGLHHEASTSSQLLEAN